MPVRFPTSTFRLGRKDANVKLTLVVTDILDVSGRGIFAAATAGENLTLDAGRGVAVTERPAGWVFGGSRSSRQLCAADPMIVRWESAASAWSAAQVGGCAGLRRKDRRGAPVFCPGGGRRPQGSNSRPGAPGRNRITSTRALLRRLCRDAEYAEDAGRCRSPLRWHRGVAQRLRQRCAVAAGG